MSSMLSMRRYTRQTCNKTCDILFLNDICVPSRCCPPRSHLGHAFKQGDSRDPPTSRLNALPQLQITQNDSDDVCSL